MLEAKRWSSNENVDQLELAAAQWLVDSPWLRPPTPAERLVERALIASYRRRCPQSPLNARRAAIS